MALVAKNIPLSYTRARELLLNSSTAIGLDRNNLACTVYAVVGLVLPLAITFQIVWSKSTEGGGRTLLKMDILRTILISNLLFRLIWVTFKVSVVFFTDNTVEGFFIYMFFLCLEVIAQGLAPGQYKDRISTYIYTLDKGYTNVVGSHTSTHFISINTLHLSASPP